METPLVTLTLERCAQVIEEVILPNLTGASAVQQAKFISTILQEMAPVLDVNSHLLGEENEEMRGVLREVVEALPREKALLGHAACSRLIKRIDRKLKNLNVGPADVIGENGRLKETLVDTINGLDALTGDLPTEKMYSLKLRIRAVLRKQIDRRVSHLAMRVQC